MPVQISRYFEMLIREVAKLEVPFEIRNDILLKLEFLRVQSLCDFDRREPAATLREVWKNVDRQMVQHGLYDQYVPSKSMWETIGMFVEIGRFRPAPNSPTTPTRDRELVTLAPKFGVLEASQQAA